MVGPRRSQAKRSSRRTGSGGNSAPTISKRISDAEYDRREKVFNDKKDREFQISQFGKIVSTKNYIEVDTKRINSDAVKAWAKLNEPAEKKEYSVPKEFSVIFVEKSSFNGGWDVGVCETYSRYGGSFNHTMRFAKSSDAMKVANVLKTVELYDYRKHKIKD